MFLKSVRVSALLPCYQVVSRLKAPRAFAQWVLGLLLCVRNGVCGELTHDSTLADALWQWAVKEAADPDGPVANSCQGWQREQISESKSCNKSMQRNK
jgi:hypothetical protein